MQQLQKTTPFKDAHVHPSREFELRAAWEMFSVSALSCVCLLRAETLPSADTSICLKSSAC